MTAAEATRLAQQDPVANLARQAGELAHEVRAIIDSLVMSLRALDKAKEALASRDVTFDVDLGPIGNAAAAARRDLERSRDQPTFELPRA